MQWCVNTKRKGQRPVPLADKELLAFPLLNRLDRRRVGPLEFLLGDDMISTSIPVTFKGKKCGWIYRNIGKALYLCGRWDVRVIAKDHGGKWQPVSNNQSIYAIISRGLQIRSASQLELTCYARAEHHLRWPPDSEYRFPYSDVQFFSGSISVERKAGNDQWIENE